MNCEEFIEGLKEYCDDAFRGHIREYQSQINGDEFQIQVVKGRMDRIGTLTIQETVINEQQIYNVLFRVSTTLPSGNGRTRTYNFVLNEHGERLK